MKRPSLHFASLCVGAVLLCACGGKGAGDEAHAPDGGARTASAVAETIPEARFFARLEPPRDLPPEKVRLGRKLFHDTGLSRDGTVSCASCHDLNRAGTDGKPRSTGISSREGERNSPSVYNLVGHVSYFWDGRAATLEKQIEEPLTHPDEMGMAWSKVLQHLTGDRDYIRAFQSVYGTHPTKETLVDAIVTFERSLMTPDAPFDAYLSGARVALSAQQQRGLQKFVRLGCVSCHQGPLLGANLFQRLGIYEDCHMVTGAQDTGRYAVTGDESDKYIFKVPSLRNVELTAPYFHDGSAPTLEAAVVFMARCQLGHDLAVDERTEIVAFLRALTSRRVRAAGEEARASLAAGGSRK